MKRRTALKLVAAPAILGLVRPARAQTKDKITFAHLLDPAMDAAVWAITTGKVKSDLITVEPRGLVIPALIQATATKQFDVITTAVIGIPPAIARGLDVRILSAVLQAAPAGEGGGVWVKKDSPIKDPRELKGKTLGSYGLRSTGYLYLRAALTKKYGLDMKLEGGDVKQVEIQAPNLPGALGAGQIDAGTLIHSQAFRAAESGEFRSIAETGAIQNELYGPLVSAVNIGFPERLKAKPDAYKEFGRMFKESVAYLHANRTEVFEAVGKQANVSPRFFEWWYDRTTNVPAIMGPQQVAAVTKGWEIGKEFGMIPAVPDVKPLIWENALTS